MLTEETGFSTSSEQLRVLLDVVVMLAQSVIYVFLLYSVNASVCLFLGNCPVSAVFKLSLSLFACTVIIHGVRISFVAQHASYASAIMHFLCPFSLVRHAHFFFTCQHCLSYLTVFLINSSSLLQLPVTVLFYLCVFMHIVSHVYSQPGRCLHLATDIVQYIFVNSSLLL